MRTNTSFINKDEWKSSVHDGEQTRTEGQNS